MFYDSWKNVPRKATPRKTAPREYAPLGKVYTKNVPFLEKVLPGIPPTWEKYPPEKSPRHLI